MTSSLATADRLHLSSQAAGSRRSATSEAERTSKNRHLADLMRAAQDGDRAAYAALLREALPLLQRLVYSRLRFLQAADREDLVQDILLSVHAARATYDPDRPFVPWLVSIAHNRMVDHARRHGRISTNEVLVDEYPEHAAGQDSHLPGEAYGDPGALRQAVIKLPPRQRQAIELIKLREMSLKEAACASGMSISALKVSVHRAIKTLRGPLVG